jgi:adenosylcobinamide kinase/adenosylcobinamide-phosphate guanylyltransferase
MARIILVPGGNRSGKSAYALKLAESLAGARVFVATAPITDDEMRERVHRHQEARSRSGWQTIEEPLDLVGVLSNAGQYEVVLVDCLTLWVNNVMHEAEKCGRQVDEDEIEKLCGDLLKACSERQGAVIFVTNEIGMGIVPDKALARRYRDLVGRCNQTVASAADVVTFVACGIPLDLKRG